MSDYLTVSDDAVVVDTQCPRCHTKRVLRVPRSGYVAWKAGAYIQHALPMLSSTDREALLTGYCDPCWNCMFGADWDEED